MFKAVNLNQYIITETYFYMREAIIVAKQEIACTDTCLLTYLPSYTQIWTCSIVMLFLWSIPKIKINGEEKTLTEQLVQCRGWGSSTTKWIVHFVPMYI